MSYHKQPVSEISKAAIRKRAQRSISLDGKSCEKCGAKESLHRHHRDYSKPEDVEILCVDCHHKEDLSVGTRFVLSSVCVICNKTFHPKRKRHSKICGEPSCLSEICKLNAEKRWGSQKNGAA